ncbi:MAG TPA: DNA polymerase IV [Gammaproteobacteria bacterium]|nr:DNA polymerase IV [Gammaproteobacteria bacterium]
MIPWRRVIALADMDAFFASVEQLDQPYLRSRAVVITSRHQGSCVISCSYEARSYGIKVGMPIFEAKQLCPLLVQCISRSDRYAEISDCIMHALKSKITPMIEQSSIDEAYLDLTAEQQLYESHQHMVEHIRCVVYQASGLSVSVGLSGDKTTAKFAAKQNKPHGYMIIPPHEACLALADVPVAELCGIGQGMQSFLAGLGVHHCQDMRNIPISVLSKRFGRIGRRVWYMCLGQDPDPVDVRYRQPKTLGHSKVLPPHTSNHATILAYCHYLTGRLAKRLRDHSLKSTEFSLGMKSYSRDWISQRMVLTQATNDNVIIQKLFLDWLNTYHKHHEAVSHLYITAMNLQQLQQLSLNGQQQSKINATLDAIHERYGLKGVMSARLVDVYQEINSVVPFGYHANKKLFSHTSV